MFTYHGKYFFFGFFKFLPNLPKLDSVYLTVKLRYPIVFDVRCANSKEKEEILILIQI